MSPIILRSAVSGAAVSIATSVALGLLARAEGRQAVQPVNSTSHWYIGNEAGKSRKFNFRHTLLGFGTHFGASVFWAYIFQAIRQNDPTRRPLLHATALSAFAAFVDYAVVPKRLTPGWEKVVSPKSITIAYIIMALALRATCFQKSKEKGT